MPSCRGLAGRTLPSIAVKIWSHNFALRGWMSGSQSYAPLQLGLSRAEDTDSPHVRYKKRWTEVALRSLSREYFG
jgi:hypothetical protein